MLTPSILPAGAPGAAAVAGRHASGTLPRRFMGDSTAGGDELMRPRTPVVAALAAVATGLTAGALPAAARTARVDVLRARALARADVGRPYPLQAGPARLATTAKKHKKKKKKKLARSGTMCPERTTSRVTGLVAKGSVKQIGRYRARVAVKITATASVPLTVQVGRSVFHDPYNTAGDLTRIEPFADYYWKTTNLNLKAGTHTYRLPARTITSREPTWVGTSNIHKVGDTSLTRRPVSGAAVQILDPAPSLTDASVTAGIYGDIVLPNPAELMMGTLGRTGVKSLAWAPNALSDTATVAATPEGPGQLYTLVNRGALDVIVRGTTVLPLAQAGDDSGKLPAAVTCTGTPGVFPPDAPNVAPPPVG
jgi:hypothetical protein